MNRGYSIDGDEILIICENGAKLSTYGNNSIKMLEKQNNIELLNEEIKQNIFDFNNKEKTISERRNELLFRGSIIFASLASTLIALSPIIYISLPTLALLLLSMTYFGIGIGKCTKSLKQLQRQYLLKNEMLTKMSDEENKELDKLIKNFKYKSETKVIKGNISNVEMLKKLEQLDQSLTKYINLNKNKNNLSNESDILVDEIKTTDQQLHDKIYVKKLL